MLLHCIGVVMKISKIVLVSLIVFGACFYVEVSLADDSSNKTMTTSHSTLSFDQIKAAAENGDADAQYALGYMFYYGKGGALKDNLEAKKWISKAAAQKQPQAMKA